MLTLPLICYLQKEDSLHGLKPIFMTLHDVPYPTILILLKKQYHGTRTGHCSLEMVKYFACFHHVFKKGEPFTSMTLTKSIWHSELCTIHKAVLFHSYNIFFSQILNTNHNSQYCNGLLYGSSIHVLTQPSGAEYTTLNRKKPNVLLLHSQPVCSLSAFTAFSHPVGEVCHVIVQVFS